MRKEGREGRKGRKKDEEELSNASKRFKGSRHATNPPPLATSASEQKQAAAALANVEAIRNKAEQALAAAAPK